ncbi:hypothetical protein [Mesorhizobium sp. M0239]|uniref:hypothetical protein n=1 Tax=Mesorhizobium sp. M0239 TaxID=2956924 RepID=UPI0033372446
MTVMNPDKAGAASLETIARNGSMLRRIAVRIPTYLSDIRENPAWLPMFIMNALIDEGWVPVLRRDSPRKN